jgi:hypothetical protein
MYLCYKEIPSAIISLNQKNIDDTIKIMDIIFNIYPLLKLCMDNATLVAKVNKAILVYKGQGDGDTR